MKTITLSNGKTYRFIPHRNRFEVMTTRFHVETRMPVWQLVTSTRLIQLLEEKFDDIICDDLTPEQRAIHNSRMGVDVYGDAFKARIEAAHAEALAIDNQMHQDEFHASSTMMRLVWTNLNHAEALRMNAELDAEYKRIAQHVPADADHSRFRAIARFYITGSGLRPSPSATFEGMFTDEQGETLAQFGNVIL